MKHTGICKKCRMKIPVGAEICPYCHTENPDIEFSKMEAIIVVVVGVLVGVIASIIAHVSSS